MTLHNYLQTLKKHNSLSWKDNVVGPQHSPTWTATCYSALAIKLSLILLADWRFGLVDDTEHGKAVAATKQTARDLAAKAALDSLLRPK